MQTVKTYILRNADYNESIIIQEELQKRLLQSENIGYMLFIDYKENIYTQGKYGDDNNVLINVNKLKGLGIKFYKTDRGGDITYHGPGQIVCYPIINLKRLKLKVKNYVFLLEEVIKEFLKDVGLTSNRVKGMPGIWIENKKIASIGVNVRRNITKHGFSINVENELSYFKHINPCGLNKLAVTSIRNELRIKVDLERLYRSLILNFERKFNVKVELNGYQSPFSAIP